MPSLPAVKSIGGITPLGKFTVTPGAPQQLTSLVSLVDKWHSPQARQIGISVSSTVAGEVYLNYGNFPGLDVHATTLIVQSGQQQSLPIGTKTKDGMIDLSKYYLDGSAACVVTVFAADMTN